MEFRNASLKDLDTIVEIYNSTVASRMVTADTEVVSVDSRIPWFNDHSEKRPLWIVENEDGKSIGWVSFQSFYGRPAYDATAEISIYMDERERGKGYGRKVLEHALEKCGDFEIKTVLGFIFAHNHPSLKLFRLAGFSDWALLPNVAVLDGIERSLVILGKRVNN